MRMRIGMGIIKVEVSLPEAVQAIEEFRRSRGRALEAMASEVRTALSGAINRLLQTEMTLFLGKPDQAGNKRNGYKEREYALKGVGCLRVRMPQDRKSRFESEIIPRHEQVDPRIKEDLAILHLAGLSARTAAMVSKRVLGVEVSTDTVSQSLDVIEERALGFLTRELGSRYWALFIDGTNFRIQRRGSVQKEPSLVVLGLDERNCYSILAVESGTKDNVEAWKSVFSELRGRGLDMGAVRIGIMDGLPGLESAFKESFPAAVTARCWVHALKNALAKTPARLRGVFKPLASAVMYAPSENRARQAFDELKGAMNGEAERAVRCLEKDLDSLLAHYRFERPLWRALKTTNPIERVNREFKRRTKSMDSLGERTLNVLVAFTAIRLEFGWQTTPVTSGRITHLKPVAAQNRIESTMEHLLH
ncbi:MAG: IS256 family transposase [Bdellovibrionales bacterium]|nr:IS256 family transposase [Bdellovibrionales bacterium]